MFHEFGHALHGMLSNCYYNTLSGTSVARDFVEMPSQFNESLQAYPKFSTTTQSIIKPTSLCLQSCATRCWRLSTSTPPTQWAKTLLQPAWTWLGTCSIQKYSYCRSSKRLWSNSTGRGWFAEQPNTSTLFNLLFQPHLGAVATQQAIYSLSVVRSARSEHCRLFRKARSIDSQGRNRFPQQGSQPWQHERLDGNILRLHRFESSWRFRTLESKRIVILLQ